jgi:ferredoxin
VIRNLHSFALLLFTMWEQILSFSLLYTSGSSLKKKTFQEIGSYTYHFTPTSLILKKKNRSRFMRSRCCLCVCISTLLTFECLNQSLWNLVLWRIYPLLGNDSVYTFQRTHNNRSCVLCGPCYSSLLGNTTILDKRRRCFHGVRSEAI